MDRDELLTLVRALEYPRGVFKFKTIEDAQVAREHVSREATRPPTA